MRSHEPYGLYRELIFRRYYQKCVCQSKAFLKFNPSVQPTLFNPDSLIYMIN